MTRKARSTSTPPVFWHRRVMRHRCFPPTCDLFQRTETIQLRTLDSVCRELDVDSIDLLKVDTEGADLRTLHGAAELLANHRIGLVLFEFYCPTSTTTENGTFFPVDSLLASHGYRLVSFYTDFVHDRQPTGVYNALYMAVPENDTRNGGKVE